jgi:hypothetical protein
MNNGQIQQSWSGIPLPNPFTWSFAVDTNVLLFSCHVPFKPESFEQSHACNSFVEGLWERDVIEFFLLDSESGKYVEFNFSPTGAWWCMLFDEYHRRSISPSFITASVLQIATSTEEWSIIVSVNIATLPFCIKFSTQFHVTSIIHNPKPTYLSSSSPHEFPPDFHRRDCFQDLNLQISS